MGNINSCFKLVYKDESTYIHFYPGKNPLSVDEVSSYLTKLNIKSYNAVELSMAVSSKQECEVLVAQRKIDPEREFLLCTISKDRMLAQVRFYMPSDGAQLMTKQEIIDALAKNGIVFGVDESVVDQFVADRQYCYDYDIAKGRPAQNGIDATIEYKFKTSKNLKPKLNEDGSVDFHSLDNINKVSKDDVLAVMMPSKPGIDGKDVTGVDVRAMKAHSRKFRLGNNTYLSEDGFTLYAAVDGHVVLNGDLVDVSDMYLVDGDVDNTTGDIDFPGSIHVTGSVLDGFRIKAKGDIIIDGVIECAQVIAGGNIIVKKGVQGRKKGVLLAKGNIVSKFIESAIIRTDGNLQTEAIMYSDISCKGAVIVTGRKGNIVGGTTRAIQSVECKVVGSQMETKTEIEVGVDPEVSNEIITLEKEIAEIQSELTNDSQVLAVFKKRLAEGKKLNAESLTLLKTTTEKYNENLKAMEKKTARYSQLKEGLLSVSTGEFIVRGTAYLGVKVTIVNAFTYIRKEVVRTKFIKQGSMIKEVPLY